jgi:hypothetical protein
MTLDNINKIEIKPIPFAHFSMKNFVDDIDLKMIRVKFTLHILYEGGSNTTAIYQSFDFEANSDNEPIILRNLAEELFIRGLEFKCVIKCTITF